jgi:acetyl esterase/lipase
MGVIMKGNRPSQSMIVSSPLKDIPYANQSKAQKLDIYLPAGVNKPYPLIIWLHPGGFFEGDKDDIYIKQMIRPILTRGYALVSINYRLSDEARFPALVFDIKAAVRWARANATKYSFNPEKIAAWGASAGGMLAALLGTSGDVGELEDYSMGNPNESSRVNAFVDWYGPTDFLQMDPQHEQLGQKPINNLGTSPESRIIGGAITHFPEKCRAINPISYIKPDNPPFYIQHGKLDDIVPYLQSVILAEALEAVMGKDKGKLELIENVGHADPIFFTQKNVNKILDFLDKSLK